MSAFTDPDVMAKCESPIEAILIPRLIDAFHPGVEWEQQRTIQCGDERFRADLWCACGHRQVVVECDGWDYHDYADDERRDVMMLAKGGITDVIRFAGGCIYGDRDGCEGWARRLLPFLFEADRGPVDLEGVILHSKGLRGTYAKPTLRSRVNPWELLKLVPALADAETFRVLIRASDAAIIQIRWPYMERRARRAGTQIGDIALMDHWDELKAASARRVRAGG